MRSFTIVVAADAELGIGKAGALPWRLKEDMKHFRDLTTGNGKNLVIMGRKTWASIPEKFRPLPNRQNVVLSKTVDLYIPGAHTVAVDQGQRTETVDAIKVTKGSLNEALDYDGGKAFVIGGGAVYAEAMDHPGCEEIIITRVGGTFDCDTFFPRYDDKFKLDSVISRFVESGIDCTIERWLRN